MLFYQWLLIDKVCQCGYSVHVCANFVVLVMASVDQNLPMVIVS